MKYDGWRDEGVCDPVVLDNFAEFLEVESGHNDCSEASVGREVD
jgi:hypothetical protein